MSRISAPNRPVKKYFSNPSCSSYQTGEFYFHKVERERTSSKTTVQASTIKKPVEKGNLFAKFILFFVLVAVIQGISNFSGHLYIEKARRDYLRNQKRFKEIDLHVRHLRAEVDKLTEVEDLNQWAFSHGFIPQELQTNAPSTSSIFLASRFSNNLVTSIIAK